MAIELSNDDHNHMTAMIYAVLDAITARQLTREEAMAAFAHVITAAAIGNEGEFAAGSSLRRSGAISACATAPAARSAESNLASYSNTSGLPHDGPIEDHAPVPPSAVTVQGRSHGTVRGVRLVHARTATIYGAV